MALKRALGRVGSTVAMAGAAAAILGVSAIAASAATVVYTFTGTSDFDVNGTTYTAIPFTMTATGDTTGFTPVTFLSGTGLGTFPSTWAVPNNTPFSVVFDLSGVGTFDMAIPGFIVEQSVPPLGDIISFGLSDNPLAPYFYMVSPTPVGLISPLGPTPEPGFGNGLSVPITGGSGDFLEFTGSGSIGTFSITVPEPAAWALMLAGFAGLGAALRTRRKLALA